MRHRVSGKQLSRTTSHRKAMRRNMAASLFQHGAIRTTEAKAKELRRFVERLITLARKGTLHARDPYCEVYKALFTRAREAAAVVVRSEHTERQDPRRQRAYP